MKQRIDIYEDGLSFKDTTKLVTLVVKNDSIPACDHIEIKVTEEGVKIERWDDVNNRFVHAYCVTFDEDFQDRDERGGQTEVIQGAVTVEEARPTSDPVGDATCLRAWIDLAKTNAHWRN
jgi:hypothetical protein